MRKEWKKLTIPNGRGNALAALHLSREGPSVIVCHGFTGKKEGSGLAVDMGEALWDLGYSCLLMDFSGCGESEGFFEDLTLTGQVGDLKAAVDYIHGMDSHPLVVMGRSFGGTTALCEAAQDNRVSGVCTWSSPTNLEDVFRLPEDMKASLIPGETLYIPEGGITLKHDFFLDLYRHDPPSSGSKLAPRPLLIIHGGRDETVPLQHSEALYLNAGHPKRLVVIGGADHRYTGKHLEVWSVFFAWLLRHFPPLRD